MKPDTKRIGAEIIASLLKGPRTTEDLRDITGCGETALHQWMKELRASGVVYRSRRRPAVYHLQTTPFAQPDADAIYR